MTIGNRGVPDTKHHQKKELNVPPWLKVMYNTVYFEECTTHPSDKKDHFCIDCCLSICPSCLLLHDHLHHKRVKIRRYVYCEVIKRKDLLKLFNCRDIQVYQTNKDKVIFLKQRPPQQQNQQNNSSRNNSNNNNNSCVICQRSLQDDPYCSIACKVLDLCGGEEGLKNITDNENEGSTRSSSKRQRRKGIPLRAPMF